MPSAPLPSNSACAGCLPARPRSSAGRDLPIRARRSPNLKLPQGPWVCSLDRGSPPETSVHVTCKPQTSWTV
ncbi:hypothetical protein R6Z07F_002543 [Ovis aries]